MRELGWLTAFQIITKEFILFVHKTIYNNHPKSIYELFTFSYHNPNNIHSIMKLIIKDHHKSIKAHKSLLYMGIYLYNKLSNDDKNLNPKKLSKYLNNNIHYYFPIDRIIKYHHG